MTNTVDEQVPYISYFYDDKDISLSWAQLQTLGKENLEDLASRYDLKIKGAVAGAERLETQEQKMQLLATAARGYRTIAKMKGIALYSESKPPLPSFRPLSYFKPGNRVIVFSSQDKQFYGKSGLFEATVVAGYRHDEGIVSFIPNSEYPKEDIEKAAGGPNTHPWVMLTSDLLYLRSDPPFAKTWVATTDKKYRTPEYADALLSPKTRVQST